MLIKISTPVSFHLLGPAFPIHLGQLRKNLRWPSTTRTRPKSSRRSSCPHSNQSAWKDDEQLVRPNSTRWFFGLNPNFDPIFGFYRVGLCRWRMHLKESFIFKLFLLLEVFTTNFLFHLNLGKKEILDLDLVATNKKSNLRGGKFSWLKWVELKEKMMNRKLWQF